MPANTTLESCPFFIGGEWLQPKLAGTPVHNPSTGDVIAECPVGTAANVNAAVEAAHAAFPAWMETPPVERARILGRFKMLMEDNFEDIVRSNTREHGKTLVESRGDVKRGMEVIEFALGVPSLLMGDVIENIARGIDCEA
ncbi:MAG: aldehyde dehydrogenase family protein, partial [Verrucomicrobiota bacterium]